MADSDKPYICYKSGLSMKITPRNAAGWRGLIAWLAGLTIPTGLFVWLMASNPTAGQATAATTGYVLATLGWAAAMARWMYVRSEVVDMNELLRLREELQRDRRGRR
ncbi:hypothetical protein [Novosphingobium sp.]|uniref:hypothetical protein n=1 Tax=Novosphingobium sp. TaxID=1874826 RepID=UPI0025E32C84|nr:hypothetical protein [Novosphingobium sp.]MCC6926330.1 hypothetical protein [Novosphingobium sp.]